jgi:hypothetical protein
MADILGMMEHISKRGEEGFKRGQNTRIAGLYQQAMQSPDQRQSVLMQMAGIDPQAAFDAQKRFEGVDEDARQQLGRYAAAFDALPDELKPQAYPQLVQQADAAGLPVERDWNPAHSAHIKQFAQAYGGGGSAQALAPRVVGNDLVDPTGKVLYHGQDSDQYAYVPHPTDPNQEVYARRRGNTFYDLNGNVLYGGEQSAQAPAPGPAQGSLVTNVESIVAPLGGRITSTNGGQHNPGSKHYLPDGAVDIGMGRETPEQQAKILAALQGNPSLAVRDERTRPQGQQVWGGPHLHVEKTGGGAAGIPGSRSRYKEGEERGDKAPTGYRFAPDGQTLVAIPGGPADRKNNPMPSDQSKGEMQMRKEVSDRLKDSRTIVNAYRGLEISGKDPSAASDMSIIFAYMKMLDPASTVREGEYASAQNTTGIPGQVLNFYNKAKTGNFLTPQQRKDFLAQAKQRADLAQQQITSISREYQGMADQYEYDPGRATGMPDFRNVQSGGSAPVQQSASGGGLSAAEQAELDQLRTHFGRK